MPLHDHPGMRGVLKLISGKLKIQSYTRIANNDSDDLLVTANPPILLDESSPASFLDEKTANYHEITALGGPAAFFDVLSPPYSDFSDNSDNSRHCHFFRKLMIDNEKNILKLEQIPCPSHYFCDSLIFEKPEFMS
jgi:cysteamine dioxygenase